MREVIVLHRSEGQRAYGCSLAGLQLLTGGLLVIVGLLILFSPDAPWALRLIAPAYAALAMRPIVRQSAAARRLASAAPGRVELWDDFLVVDDPSVFVGPVCLVRADVAAIERAPSGTFAYGVFGVAAKEDAALVSLTAEKPTVLVRFDQPRVLTEARDNVGAAGGFALQPPDPRRAVRGLWLRTASEADVDRLMEWLRSS